MIPGHWGLFKWHERMAGIVLLIVMVFNTAIYFGRKISIERRSNKQNDFMDSLTNVFNLNYKLRSINFEVDEKLAPIQLSCSIGGACSSEVGCASIHDLLRVADMRMSKAKGDVCQPGFCEKDLPPAEYSGMLGVLAEKDMYSFFHSQNVVKYAVRLAKALGFSHSRIEELSHGAWLHDIGKILVNENILRKHGKLTPEEYAIMKRYVEWGVTLVQEFRLSETALNGLKYHHERWDGRGYPFGIISKELPEASRVIQIADAFSAMTLKRLYREPMSIEAALEELARNKSSQFDPELVDLFIKTFQVGL